MRTPYGEPRGQWSGLIKTAFIVTLTLLCFLLARSMVHHRFFSGSLDNYGARDPEN